MRWKVALRGRFFSENPMSNPENNQAESDRGEDRRQARSGTHRDLHWWSWGGTHPPEFEPDPDN
jgi:hypothetical protein